MTEKVLPFGPDTNVEMLQRIKALILEEPRRFFMSWWAWTEEDGFSGCDEPDEREGGEEFEFPPCGTAACLCGWTNLLADRDAGIMDEMKKTYPGNVSRTQEVLGITYQESEKLFFVDADRDRRWPEPFRSRYLGATSREEKARVAADLLDWASGMYEGEVDYVPDSGEEDNDE